MKVAVSLLLALTAAVATFVTSSNAATLVGTTSDATGIDGLVVDGITYDVTFVTGSYDTVYASNTPTFFGNSSGASDAATALASALNSLAVTTLTWAVPTELPSFSRPRKHR